jgi:hypothetical protein
MEPPSQIGPSTSTSPPSHFNAIMEVTKSKKGKHLPPNFSMIVSPNMAHSKSLIEAIAIDNYHNRIR